MKEHYAHIADKPFFPEIVEYMTSGPVFGMIVEGENAVQGMRIIMGATKFEEATAVLSVVILLPAPAQT